MKEIDKLLENFRLELKHIFLKQGITQEEVAEKLNVSRETVNKWLSGKILPRFDKFLEICLKFYIYPEVLLDFNYVFNKLYSQQIERVLKFKRERVHNKYNVYDIRKDFESRYLEEAKLKEFIEEGEN